LRTKAPSFPFYPGDWTRDTRRLSPGAKGAWIDILCDMHWSESRGELSLSVVAFARMIGAAKDEARDIIYELKDADICDVEFCEDFDNVTDRNANVTLKSRRMVREEKAKKSNRSRVENFRRKKSNSPVTVCNTLPSSSSSSSSSKKKETLSDSGKPEPDDFHRKLEVKAKLRLYKKQAGEILDFLNLKTDHNYRHVLSSISPIVARLKSGITPGEIRQVIAMKAREWKNDEKMACYLRPKTLFSRNNLENYLGQLIKTDNAEGESQMSNDDISELVRGLSDGMPRV